MSSTETEGENEEIFQIIGIAHPSNPDLNEGFYHGVFMNPEELSLAAPIIKGKPALYEHQDTMGCGNVLDAFVQPDSGALLAVVDIDLKTEVGRATARAVENGTLEGFSYGSEQTKLSTAESSKIVDIKINELSVVGKPGVPGAKILGYARVGKRNEVFTRIKNRVLGTAGDTSAASASSTPVATPPLPNAAVLAVRLYNSKGVGNSSNSSTMATATESTSTISRPVDAPAAGTAATPTTTPTAPAVADNASMTVPMKELTELYKIKAAHDASLAAQAQREQEAADAAKREKETKDSERRKRVADTLKETFKSLESLTETDPQVAKRLRTGLDALEQKALKDELGEEEVDAIRSAVEASGSHAEAGIQQRHRQLMDENKQKEMALNAQLETMKREVVRVQAEKDGIAAALKLRESHTTAQLPTTASTGIPAANTSVYDFVRNNSMNRGPLSTGNAPLVGAVPTAPAVDGANPYAVLSSLVTRASGTTNFFTPNLNAPPVRLGADGVPQVSTRATIPTLASGTGANHPAFLCNRSLGLFGLNNPDFMVDCREGKDTRFIVDETTQKALVMRVGSQRQ